MNRIDLSKRVLLRAEIPEGKRIGRLRGMDIYLEGEIGEDYLLVVVYGGKTSSGRRNVISKLSLSNEYCDGAYHVDLMEVDCRYQGHGIAPLVYRYLLRKLGIVLQAGVSQSAGGRKLWAQLAKMKDVTVFASYRRGKAAYVVDLDKDDEELHVDGIKLYDGRPIYTFAVAS